MGPIEIIKEMFGWMAEPPLPTIFGGLLLLAFIGGLVYAFVKEYVRARGYELEIGYKTRKEDEQK